MFQLQNAPALALELPGVKLSRLEADTHHTNFDLVMVMWEQAEGLRAAADYRADLFDDDTIARMLGHFQTLLEAIAADPEQPVERLPLLTEVERHQLLFEWCDTKKEYQTASCLHELLAEQAARTPDAPAVVYEGRTLTYGQLDRRANQLAHQLRWRGVGPESVVGVYLERSLELVVSLLGILKAGGAYLPLDPSYPTERLSFMLKDAQAPLLLTHPDLGPGVAADAPHVAALDASDLIWGSDDPLAEGCPASGVRGENLAYVIYTSGSTGRPKGAMNTHRAIVNRLLWMQDAYRLTADDTVLQKTPCGFDVSVWEFFWPLLVGARLIVARPGGHQDSAYLAEVIKKEQVTTAHFVPSMLQVFVEEPGAAGCRSLRRVVCSGEELGARLAERMLGLLDVELHNLYGPTEAAVDVTAWACERGATRQRVPIGWPIANMRVYVLDPGQVPLPPGVPGEIYIGGVGLARGYVGRPGQTAERFVPDAVGDEPGARLYRTGDRGRYLPNGAIEFLRRIDGQVKVRGNRIELGEVEAVLGEHTGVREAVVEVRPGAGDEQRLVAYVVPGEGGSVAVGELRSFLRAKLPEYMLPSRFVMMGALPLTANGKLDRRALPEPDWARPELERAYVAPRTPVEEELARLWQELLKVERVGIHDNFFGLGGHSLLLTQLASRIRSAFHVELPLRILFDVPTITEMTLAVAEKQVEREDSAAIAQMLGNLSQLSPDEVKALLAAEGQVS
jgi:amino acid adenylation domain-containing protein